MIRMFQMTSKKRWQILGPSWRTWNEPQEDGRQVLTQKEPGRKFRIGLGTAVAAVAMVAVFVDPSVVSAEGVIINWRTAQKWFARGATPRGIFRPNAQKPEPDC